MVTISPVQIMRWQWRQRMDRLTSNCYNPMYKATAYLILSLAGLTACVTGQSSAPRLSLTVAPASIPNPSKSATGDWIVFPVELSIRNSGGAATHHPFCYASLERLEGESWRQAWVPTCKLSVVPADTVRGNSTITRTMTVSAAIAGTATPRWGASGFPGRYRVVLSVIPAGGSRSDTLRVRSNEFTIAN
jgi:hypothetical protein